MARPGPRLIILLVVAAAAARTPGYCAKSKENPWLLQALHENADLKTQAHALKLVNSCLATNPNDANTWKVKAMILSGQEESEQALPCINKAIELDPKMADAYSVKAEILSALRRNAEALKSMDMAIKLDPNPLFPTYKARVLSTDGRYAEAEKLLDDVLKKNPKDELARIRRAGLAKRLAHYDKQMEDLNFMIATTTDPWANANNKVERCNLYRRQKKYDLAKVDYLAIIKSYPDFVLAHQGLLALYQETGDKPGAEAEKKVLHRLVNDFSN